MRENLGDKTLFVTYREQCFQINSDSCVEIEALKSNQEEADTRLFLHPKHAAETYPSIICVSGDTDVLIICLGLMAYITSKIFIRRGTRSCNRFVDVKKLASAVGHEVCTALIGLHPWSGCDTVRALADQAKLKALKILSKNNNFTKAISSIGTSWVILEQIFDII